MTDRPDIASRDNDAPELLPCPFCGERALCHPLTMDARGRDLLHTYWLVRCTKCGARLEESTDRAMAVEAWNGRW